MLKSSEITTQFSIIMPVFLGEYPGAATDRVRKFHRAIKSVMDQTYRHWQLVIVVDGCPIAEREAARYVGNPCVDVVVIPKQRIWSPEVRNAGLREATGTYAIYLDSDDYYGPGHLSTAIEWLTAAGHPAWGAMDELVWDVKLNDWKCRLVSGLLKNARSSGWHAGTPNMVHRTDLGLMWPTIAFRYPNFGYGAEDRAMVEQLQSVGEPLYIPGTEYHVCHIPFIGGYDV